MKYIWPYILFLFFTIDFLSGQIIPFKNYTVHDGLPSNYVSDIVQDKKGYLWFATDIGLAKFDGYHFENYTIEKGLSDNYIRCITTDSKGQVWCGTEAGGVAVVNDFGVRTIKESDGLFPGPVSKIFADKEDNIWACCEEEGVSIIAKDTVQTFKSDNSIISGTIFCHYLDSDGTVWLGTYEGVYYFDSVFHYLKHPLLDQLIVRGITRDNSGWLWIASQDNGVFAIKGDSVISYNTGNGLTTNTTLSILKDKKGRIVVGTYDGGINIIEENKVNTRYSEASKDDAVWQLFEDSKGRIWGRTLENGVMLVHENEIKSFSKENALVSNYVLNIFEDDYSNVWFVSEDGVSKYGKAFFETFKEGFVLEDKNILSLFIDDDGTVYTGSYSGFSVFHPDGEIKGYSNEEGLPEEPTVGAILKNEGKLFLGTYGLSHYENNVLRNYHDEDTNQKVSEVYAHDFIYKDSLIYGATELGLLVQDLRNSKFKFFKEEDGLVHNKLYSVAVDDRGRIWCGSAKGISVFDGKNFHNYTVRDGLPNNFCNDITFDDRGVAWIATDFGVCSAVLSEKFVLSTRNYSQEDGFRSNSVLSIQADTDGNIWIGHNMGVDKLNPRHKTVKQFGFEEGFLPIENNLGAITSDNYGNIWFGTVNGLVKYTPKNDNLNKLPPKALITRVNLYNDTTALNKFYSEVDSVTKLPANLVLPHSRQNLVFRYVGLHFTIVSKNTYRYRLLGYESEWSEPTNEIMTPPYRKLPHGKYTFQLIASNCDGIWTEKPAEFTFRILPPWWKTLWARILQVFLVGFVLWFYIYLRIRKLRRDKKVLLLKVRERTKEIEKQKDQIEKQRDEISRQKEAITDSIVYAEHIQSAILHKDDTISKYIKEYFILFKPRDIVSGDFYWINGYGEKVIAIAADCTGHGVPGALMSMLGVSILNQVTSSGNHLPAGEILNLLREKIINTLSHTRENEEARDGMDIALCIVDFEALEAEFAGAYNPLVIVREQESLTFKGDRMPVGSTHGQLKSFNTQNVELRKGDMLYLFSDGYADQFGGSDGKKFKTAPFRKLLCQISQKTMQEQKRILDQTIVEWMGSEEQVDDIIVFGIKVE